MTRHLDLGDNRHEALLGICHDVTHLSLGVVATMRYAVPMLRVNAMAYERLLTHRALGSKLGVALDLDAPALVVGEVPM